MTAQRAGTLQVTLPDDLSNQLVRDFAAPAARVFEAHTQPEHVRRWWGFPSAEWLACEIDLRVGGRWRFATREEDGTEVEFYGEYREISAPLRLVHTEVFAPFPDNGSVVTITLEERDGRTRLTSISRYDSRETRDMVVQTGMEEGAALSYDRMEDLLANPG